MEVNKFLWEQTDTVDATVFTGDCLFEKVNRDHLKYMCHRWLNNIAIFEETESEENKAKLISAQGAVEMLNNMDDRNQKERERLIKIIEGMPAEYIPEGFWKLKGEDNERKID